MTIIKATKKDLKEISLIHFIETKKKPYNQKWTEKTALDKIRELFEKGEIYFIRINKEIIGYVAVYTNLGSRGKTIVIDELWLKKEYQGKGHGRELIKFIEELSKKKNIKTIALISDKNSKAFGFYKKLKFIPHFEDVLMSKRI